jgi:DNA adenine methylase
VDQFQGALPGLGPTRPFLRWLGRKTQIIPDLLKRVPRNIGTYHEPFLGSGALFFALRPPVAVLSDINDRLIRTFKVVRDDVVPLIDKLKLMPVTDAYYQAMREIVPDELTDREVAAWMIYVNRRSFNGVYRVNQQGGFNTPPDRLSRRTVCDSKALMASSLALEGADLYSRDFEDVRQRTKPGDFVYCDPPFVPTGTSKAHAYDSKPFTWDDQRRLHAMAKDLKHRGISVLISISASSVVFELYRQDFEIDVVRVKRLVSAGLKGRQVVDELLIY